MNAQTPGPLLVDLRLDEYGFTDRWPRLYDSEKTLVAPSPEGEQELATAQSTFQLLAASYTAFDKAGRELGIDAAELARTIPLTEVIRYALDYTQLHTAAHNRGDVGRPDQVKAAQITLNKLAKQLVLIQ